jgi:hypothetical protein
MLPEETTLRKLQGRCYDTDIDVDTVQIDDIYSSDYPDFSDAFVLEAKWKDGTALTEEELRQFNELEQTKYLISELIHENVLYL